MDLLRKIILCGVLGIGLFGMSGCCVQDQDAYKENSGFIQLIKKREINPKIISGGVTSENYSKHFLNSDIYAFSLNSKEGKKLFYCREDAKKFDLLINPGDSLVVKTFWYEQPNDLRGRPLKNDYTLRLNEILSINGKEF